jgi:hypothetical protein
VAPFVDFGVDVEGDGASRVLGDDSLGSSGVKLGDDGVAVEGRVAEQGVEIEPLNEGRYADGVEPMAGQQDEADQVAEGVGERQDLGGPAAL